MSTTSPRSKSCSASSSPTNPAAPRIKRPITKEAIFHYDYGVLHDPVYREKHAQNLKREFPRTPICPDAHEPSANAKADTPKALFKADKEAWRILLDT